MSVKNTLVIDTELLSYLQYGRNIHAKSLLTEDSFKASNDFGSLLHYAALYGEKSVVQHMINQGVKIDGLGRGNNTPLMLAVKGGHVGAVKILLKANANIDRLNDNNESALNLALSQIADSEIVKVFACKLQNEASSIVELANRLIAAGCNISSAASLKNINLLEQMLKHRMNINSKDLNGKTALHKAVVHNDLNLAKWLIINGIDMMAIDKNKDNAFLISAKNGNKDIMQCLLDYGADPNNYMIPDRHVMEQGDYRNYMIPNGPFMLGPVADPNDMMANGPFVLGPAADPYDMIADRFLMIEQAAHHNRMNRNRHLIREQRAHPNYMNRNRHDMVERRARPNYMNPNRHDILEQGFVPIFMNPNRHLMMEQRAYPNDMNSKTPLTIISEKYVQTPYDEERYIDCAEILLQYGAVLDRNSFTHMITHLFHRRRNNTVYKMLIAHVAMLEMLRKSVTEFVTYYQTLPSPTDFRNFHQSCLQTLKIVVYEKLSLFDLLKMNEKNIRLLVRNEMFALIVKKVCFEQKINESYTYYYKTLMNRISRANRIVKLEDQAVLIICKIFDGNYNQCYNFARKVFMYLNQRDLEQLLQV